MGEVNVIALMTLAHGWIRAEKEADDYGPGAAYDGRDCAEMPLDALNVNHKEQP